MSFDKFRQSAFWPLCVAAAAVLMAMLVRAGVHQLTGAPVTYLIFFPAIIGATLFGGWIGGTITVVASVLISQRWPLLQDPNAVRWDPTKGLGVSIFVCTAGLVIAIGEWANRSRAAAKISRTQAARASEKARTYEERFQTMANSAPVLVWIADSNRGMTWFNQPWLDFVGRPMEKEVGIGWQQNIHPDDRDRCLRTFETHFAGKHSFTREYRLRRHDGMYRWVMDNAVPLHETSGRFAGFIGSCVDITVMKESEQERSYLLEAERAARGEAERVSRMKDEFLANLSHELRTPLNAILGWSQLLSRTGNNDADLSKGLETIERNARVQMQLIDDLLDMSRIISGKIRLDVQPVDLPSVVETAVDSIMPGADAKGVQVRRVIDPHAGPVSGDPNRLQQVVWNLLTNAIKFTPKNGKIEVLLARVNSHVDITVSDTGIGIEAGFLPSVFERFRQSDSSTTRRHGGLGLGLAIVKQLVELHGGSVQVKSAGLSKGSTFVVSLPLAISRREGGSQHPTTMVASKSDPHPISLAGVKILVVEDEQDARAMISKALTNCDAEVLTAESARQAMEILQTQKPTVLVSDIGMPDKDGYQFMREVRALPSDRGGTIPAAALTAFARSEDRTRAMLAGYQMHLAKPVELRELVVTVASLAGRASGIADAPAAKPSGESGPSDA